MGECLFGLRRADKAYRYAHHAAHRHVMFKQTEQGRRRITENKELVFLLLGDSDIDGE